MSLISQNSLMTCHQTTRSILTQVIILESSPLASVIKIFTAEYLKQNNIQHYVVQDRQIPIIVVIRELPRSTDTELIKETLSCTGFSIIKMKSERDGKLLTLLPIEIPKNET